MSNVEHLIENALVAATHNRNVIEIMNQSRNKEMLEIENMTALQMQHIIQYLLYNWIDIYGSGSDLIHRDELRVKAENWAEEIFANESDNYKYNSLLELIDDMDVENFAIEG